MDSISSYCEEMARNARVAARQLPTLPGSQRDRALHAMARRLRDERPVLLAANAADISAAGDFGLTTAQVDRLRLDDKRLLDMARAVDEIVQMPEPLGRTIESTIRPNGLEIRKVRVPLGVVFFLYESRPNVTTDAAALCLKSGNAVILRGGKEALHSNRALGDLIRASLAEAGLPAAAACMVEIADRAVVGELLKLRQYIDVAIPRGGEELIRRVAAEATMPVIKHFLGVCHIFLDESADEAMAVRVTENAKCQRPGVCNAVETLLVHADSAPRLLPAVADRMRARGVELRGCERACVILPDCRPAAPDDFGKEFLDLILAVKIVDNLDAALEHIARYGSGHTDAIITQDLNAARRFTTAVDSSAVVVNASTRFNDGGQFGLGAEIGISTDKLHARGPCGLNELTTYKYVVYGDGQIRE